MKDYYKILELPTDQVDLETIKGAYRKLVKKCHPDVAGDDAKAEERFKQITEAYETLSDVKKRAVYDTERKYVRTGFGDIFGKPAQDGTNIGISVRITLKEAYEGCKKPVKYSRIVQCDHCQGTCSETKETFECPTCNGTGNIDYDSEYNWFWGKRVIECPTCRGTGRIPKEPCKHCTDGFVVKEHEIEIDIPAGIRNGQNINLWGCGNVGRKSTGALRVTVYTEYQWNGIIQDISGKYIKDICLTPAEAVLGCKKWVPWFSGDVEIKVPAGIQHGAKFLTLNNKYEIHVIIEMPRNLTDEKKKLWEGLLQLDNKKD